MFGYDEIWEEVVDFSVLNRRVVFSVNEDKGIDFFFIIVVYFLKLVKSDFSFFFIEILFVFFVWGNFWMLKYVNVKIGDVILNFGCFDNEFSIVVLIVLFIGLFLNCFVNKI